MKIAIISDIHSNYFALKPVLEDINNESIDRLIVLGDIFGYYPWANETYELLIPFIKDSIFIKGNHDQLLLEKKAPLNPPTYWIAAKQNEADLLKKYPESIEWLKSLSFNSKFRLDGISFNIVHGTPVDKENGRFYPDDNDIYPWFPEKNEILLSGHTHYPFLKDLRPSRGIIFNPGSVGQPRDGNPMPSWSYLNTDNLEFKFKRSVYNNFEVMKLLEKLNWEKRSILSLNKKNKGKLII